MGDTVWFTLGTTPIHGVVIDDRGPIGANRVRIFRIRVPNDPYDEDVFEMPEDELVLEDKSIESIPVADIVSYLKHGGLLQILKANMSGGRNQPRLWLAHDSLGHVVHTFIAERGKVGGATIPFSALHDNRVFEPKLGEVLTFLSTFGLSQRDAQEVVAAVGTVL